MCVAIVDHQPYVSAVDILVFVRDLSQAKSEAELSHNLVLSLTYRANMVVLAMTRDGAPRVVSNQALNYVLFIGAILVQLFHKLL